MNHLHQHVADRRAFDGPNDNGTVDGFRGEFVEELVLASASCDVQRGELFARKGLKFLSGMSVRLRERGIDNVPDIFDF